MKKLTNNRVGGDLCRILKVSNIGFVKEVVFRIPFRAGVLISLWIALLAGGYTKGSQLFKSSVQLYKLERGDHPIFIRDGYINPQTEPCIPSPTSLSNTSLCPTPHQPYLSSGCGHLVGVAELLLGRQEQAFLLCLKIFEAKNLTTKFPFCRLCQCRKQLGIRGQKLFLGFPGSEALHGMRASSIVSFKDPMKRLV